MFSYLAFVTGKIKVMGTDTFAEGQALAQQCIKQLSDLNDPKQFPPRLLILLTSAGARELPQAQQLLAGIHNDFAKEGHKGVPLIGGSVVAVFFDRAVYPKGALLACVASRAVDKVEVAVAENVSKDAPAAIDKLLANLKLNLKAEDLNPFANRMLFALFPGFCNQNYQAPELHRQIQQKLKARMPIFGGVTSSGDEDRILPGLLYAGNAVYQDAVVAARVASGTPLGFSLVHGLTPTKTILQVKKLGSDPRTIRQFHQGAARKVKEREEVRHKVMLLENISASGQSVIGKPSVGSKHCIQMLRKIEEGAAFRVLQPEARTMAEVVAAQVQSSCERVRLENAIACLGFRCAGYYRHGKEMKLNLRSELEEIEKLTGIPFGAFVGAFMDGEASMDNDGRSSLSNWHTATMVFGDELRDRTTFQKGFTELAFFARRDAPQTPAAAFDALLKLIYNIGFPGAMISLVLHDEGGTMIVAQKAWGARFQSIVEMTRRPWEGTDILAMVGRSQTSEFIPDVADDPRNDAEAVRLSGLVSQYVIPLKTLRGGIIALLQIDLGNARYKRKGLHPNEMALLDALGNVVNSSLNRVFNWEQTKIIGHLDKALKDCLSKKTIEEGLNLYLAGALKAFGCQMGHIRVYDKESARLVLRAGIGAYYTSVAHKSRKAIDLDDPSPSVRAFLKPDKPIVTNIAAADRHHGKMTQQFAKHPASSKAMREVGSYINVGFATGNGESGTISLVSTSPWFFNWFHELASQALGERVGFLIEHLRSKENVAAARKRRRAVGAQVALIAQSSHRFGHRLGELVSLAHEVKSAGNAAARKKKFGNLAKSIEEARDEITQHINLANRAIELDIRPRKFKDFVTDVVAIAQATAPGIDFRQDVPDDLILEIDGNVLDTAFLNLINNSVDAMKEPGVRRKVLSITVPPVSGGSASIIFKDTGKGMTRKFLNALNKQIDGGRIAIRDRTIKSTGWGLPITSVLLEAHGGKIHRIKSGKSGTSVTVTLPADHHEGDL